MHYIHTIALAASFALTTIHLDFDMTSTHDAIIATVLVMRFTFLHFRINHFAKI